MLPAGVSMPAAVVAAGLSVESRSAAFAASHHASAIAAVAAAPSAAPAATPHSSNELRAPQYFHSRQVSHAWADLPLARSSSGSYRASPFGFSLSPSPSSFSDDVAAGQTAQLTPNEVREEREHERARRRMAMRRKLERSRSSRSLAASSGGSLPGSLPNSPRTHSNTKDAPLPSRDESRAQPASHAASAFSPFGFARPRTFSATSRLESGFGGFSSSSAPPPHTTSSSMSTAQLLAVLSSPGVTSSRRSASDDSHRIDMPSEPDGPSALLERANASFWNAIRAWDSATRQKAFSRAGACNAIVGVAFVLICASTHSTTFANPIVHWSAQLLALFTIALGYLLHWAARNMDMFVVLLWVICTSMEIVALVLLSIVSVPIDSLSLGPRVHQEWTADSITADTKSQYYHDHYDELRKQCRYHLALIGGTSISIAALLLVLVCMVGTIRSHACEEADALEITGSRLGQFHHRLRTRQRMARIGAQMKERRRLRKSRGRHTPVGVFTGVGSQPTPTGNWSDTSATDEAGVQMTMIVATGKGKVIVCDKTTAPLLAASASDDQRGR